VITLAHKTGSIGIKFQGCPMLLIAPVPARLEISTARYYTAYPVCAVALMPENGRCLQIVYELLAGRRNTKFIAPECKGI
jgi:hypothetical protein